MEDTAIWKLKTILKKLDTFNGNGTSMITILLSPTDQLSKINKLLTEEYSTATNIKSRVNRASVQSAIVTAQQLLKLYTKIPKNGLALFCGMVEDKMFKLAMEPPCTLCTTLYMCDNIFHTAELHDMLKETTTYGFIIMDGHGTLFAQVSGNSKKILFKTDDPHLPSKHSRGGQSALRFARLREESRHNYVRKVSELASQLFVHVDGIILAGSADFKTVLSESDLLDKRLKDIIIDTVDLMYGGEMGLTQAIKLSADKLQSLRFIREANVINRFFESISKSGDNKICYGISDTLYAIQLGAVDTLIVWEELDETLLNTLIEQKSQYTLHLITDCTSEGTQFVKGFGGIGGLLRFPVIFEIE